MSHESLPSNIPAVAVATMKILDINALSLTSSMPTYTAGAPPRPSIMALILLTELRYESFTPNPIRLPPNYPSTTHLHMNEKAQLLLHTSIFAALQSLPQTAPIKALGVLFSIWIIWTAYQLILRYRSSPPLFGPIYLADSLAGFWTDTWHNAFAAPCYSLAYSPALFVLAALGFPRVVARGVAVVSGFALMALFHMYALSPVVDDDGLGRVGVFFVGNGVMTVVEAMVWGKKKHWVRAAAAWVLELGIASWAVEGFGLPDGLVRAEWEGMCRPRR